MKKIKLLLAILALLVPIAVSAQSKKSFERAMKEPRSFGKAYFLCKDSRGRPEEYMSKAEKYGYVITPSDNRFMVYFVPKSEYEAYMHEYSFCRSGVDDASNCVNTNLRGGDFKSEGAAWLLDRKPDYDPHFTNTRNGRTDSWFKCTNIKWTGEVKNGMLNGKGDGYALVKTKMGDVYYSVSGEFRDGVIVNAWVNRGYVLVKGLTDRKDFSTVKVTMGVPVDGNRPFRLVSRIKGDKQFCKDYCGFVDDQFQFKGGKFNNIVQEYRNGQAIVTDRGLDIVLDRDCNFVRFAKNITEIPKEYFAGNTSLKTITIPSSVTTIGNDAFRDCENLTEVKFTGTISILGWACFKGCRSLKSINLSRVTDDALGEETFRDCIALRTVTLPANLKSIGWSCFENCRSLTSINLPKSLTTLKDHAYRGCSGLTSATINSYVSRGEGVFKNCSGLKAVTVRAGGQTKRETDRLWFEDKPKPQKTYTSGSSSYSSNSKIDIEAITLSDFKYEMDDKWKQNSLNSTEYSLKITFWDKDGSNEMTSYIFRNNKGLFTYLIPQGKVYYNTLTDAIIAEYVILKYRQRRETGSK